MIQPKRVVLILPCCIGDVVMATATLQALRRGWPEAHITWAVGGWSKQAVDHHPLLDAILDTGPAALPVKSPHGFVRFVSQLRGGHFDLAVSLVRSPLMSLAVRLSGIPQRAGLDSAGRGFGYNLRVRSTRMKSAMKPRFTYLLPGHWGWIQAVVMPTCLQTIITGRL